MDPVSAKTKVLANDALSQSKAVDQLKNIAGQSDVDMQKLEQVAREFEAFFVGFVFEQAQKTIDKSQFLKRSNGEDFYQTMFVQELSNQASTKGQGFGLADQLISQVKQAHGYGVNQHQDAQNLGKSDVSQPTEIIKDLDKIPDK